MSFLAFKDESITLPFVVIVEKVQKTVHEKGKMLTPFFFDAVEVQVQLTQIAAAEIGARETRRRGIRVDRMGEIATTSYEELK